jgi:DNA-binding CsgD family transcriptional regulator
MRVGRIERMWGAEALRPAVGWKVWRVEHGREETRLRSVLYGDLWVPGRPVEADCKRLLRSGHDAPSPGCGCGIHAGRELSAWEHYLSVDDPSVCVISTEELQSLVFTLGTGLSKLEADALKLYLEGESYETMAERLGCDTKTIDNALQRVKRKVLAHQESRQVLQ